MNGMTTEKIQCDFHDFIKVFKPSDWYMTDSNGTEYFTTTNEKGFTLVGYVRNYNTENEQCFIIY